MKFWEFLDRNIDEILFMAIPVCMGLALLLVVIFMGLDALF